MSDFEYRPPADGSEADALIEILVESFRFNREFMTKWRALVGEENLRVVRGGPRITAGLGILDVGQWFGGKLLPMGAIVAVGVAPDVRGSGVGKAMMAEVIRELHGRGVVLSALYASTQRLYRSVGYEQAGSAFRYSAPARAFPADERTLPAHRVDLDHLDTVKALRRAFGRTVNGFLRRNETMWQYTVRPIGAEALAYTVGPASQPEGLIIFRQIPGERGFDLELKDFFATTPRGWGRLCTFIADHRSLADRVFWDGPPVDPRLLLLSEQDFRVEKLERFMLRIVDVPAALAGRGYPSHLTETLALTVDDPLIPENSGAFTLRIEGGEGAVERGGNGGLRVGVRTLAPLFSGLFSATVLAGLGRITGSDDAVATADRIFRGPAPTMTDRF